MLKVNIHKVYGNELQAQLINLRPFLFFLSQDYILKNDGKIFLFLGEGQHKIKRKAEQIACAEALSFLNFSNDV